MRRLLLRTLLVSVLLSPRVWAQASSDFNGTTSVETCGTAVTLGGTFTFAVWMNPDGTGEAGSGRLLEKGNGSNYAVFFVTTNQATRFIADWSTTDGAWTSDTTNSTGVWTHAAMTYDDSSTTNDPIFYINGAATTSTETATPAVTRNSETGSFRIGNNSAGTRTFDGRLAYAHVYNRILALWEIQEIMRHPGSIRGGLIFYRTLFDISGVDLSGNGNTCTLSNMGTSADGPAIFLMTPVAALQRGWAWLDRWLTPLAWADEVVLCNPTDPTVANRVTSYEHSADPYKSGATTNPNALIWSLPASPTHPWNGVVPSVAQSYWKCSGATVVEMSAGEQAAVDAETATLATQNYWNAVQDGRVPSGAILLLLAGSCPVGYTEATALNGRTLLGTLAANADVGTTGGTDSFTPAGSNTAPTFTGTASTVVVNHTHPYASQTATTGSISSYEHGAIDTTSTAAEASITTNAPAGGAASYTPAGSVSAPLFTGTSGENRSAFTRVIFCQKQ